MVGIGAFRVFMRTRLNIEPYSLLKPTKVGFIFIGPNLKQGQPQQVLVRATSESSSFDYFVLKVSNS